MSSRMRKNMSNRKTNNSNLGFTLIEIVISIAILALVSVPLMHYFTNSIRYSSMMEARQQATFLAQEITEGLLAENRLVLKSTDAGGNKVYTVPYFDGTEWVGHVMEVRTDDELVITATKDGYRVEVTIDNPDEGDDVQDLLDYRIDPFANVVHIDTTENTQAEFELMGMHNTYRFYHESEGLPSVDEKTIRENMSRDIHIELKKVTIGSENKYRIIISYHYKCSEVKNMNGGSGEWSIVALDKTVEELHDLQNIYLIYNWCDNGDTVTLTSDFNIDLGLYIICQQRTDGTKLPTGSYTLKVVHPDFLGTLSGYTNLESGQLQDSTGAFGSSGSVFMGDAKSALVYTIHTKVYLKGDVTGEDLLAEITTTKGE